MKTPLLFKPFKKLEEKFCRENLPGAYFQKLISIEQTEPAKIEIKVMNDTSYGCSGTSLSLNPKQVIVLRDLLAQIRVVENNPNESQSQKTGSE